MPYQSTTWVDGSTQGTHVTMNNLETQYAEATLSFEQDLFTPFVLTGLVASKDGSIANQLDVTAGTAFLKQPDGTLRRRAPVSTTFTTSAPSTTYYLDLNPDGTGLQWGTSHSGTANYLPICQVTTDGSGNIATVTDERQLNTSLLGGMAGSVSFSGGGVLVGTSLTGTSGTLPISSQQSGAANGVSFKSWNGTGGVVPFSIGGQFNGALSWVDNSGNFIGGGTVQSTGVLLKTDDSVNKTGIVSPAVLGANPRSVTFQSWDGSAAHNALSIGTNGFQANAAIHDDGSAIFAALTLLSGSKVSRVSMFTASGISGGTNTAVNHGLGATPTIVLICPTTGSSSATIGAFSFTSTQVTVVVGGGGSGPWSITGIAMA